MNKRTLSICGAAMFLSMLVSSAFGYEKEIEQLSAQMAEKIAGKGKKTVAVVDFTDLEGNVTQLDKFIAEEFSVALASAGKGFRVIDRTHLKSIIKEHKLSATGLIDIDPAMARKLGKIAGVDALVTGTLTPFGDNVRLTVKVLDAETAEVIDAGKSNFAKTQAVEELLDKEMPKTSTGSEDDINQKREMQPEDTSKEVEGFIFNLKGCKKRGDAIHCSLNIISNEKDRDIKIRAHHPYFETDSDANKSPDMRTAMYDNAGYEYTANKIFLGGTEAPEVSRRLVAGVSTAASFEFKGVSQTVNTVSLLEVLFFSKGDKFKVQFRNIPISK